MNSIILDKTIKREIKGKVINSRIDGRVTIMEDTKIVNSTVRESCITENSYIGSYISIDSNTKITGSSIEYSIVLKGAAIEGIDRLEESLIGENAKPIYTQETVRKSSYNHKTYE